MKKVLIIATGAREHVLGETLKRSKHGVDLFVYGSAKNPGLLKLSSGYELGGVTDFDRLREVAKAIQPDFVIPG
ncbi:MAG: phosphoribosylamine--glycine ligase, partial [Candidatus Peregrinibacteria bacterium]|nr:phosphoribosylamine--glycine ligase [Candidatus Peregrinibacteria bacterium]